MDLLLRLLALHALCDFPLQGDFLARGKNHLYPIPCVPWQICLLAHALIHAGAYSLVLPLADACLLGWMHLLVDYSKSAGLLDRPRRGRLEGLPKGKGPESFWADQVLHVAFLVLAAWWAS